jgi:YgiT-type zinc finger domain-containing protein
MHSIESFNLIDQPVCPVCHVGRMSPRLSVYVRQFGETLVNVPNTPAWECDVCHAREFDPAAVQRVEMLVGHAGAPPNHFRPTEISQTSRTVENAAPKSTKPTKKSAKPKTTPLSEDVSRQKARSKAKP